MLYWAFRQVPCWLLWVLLSGTTRGPHQDGDRLILPRKWYHSWYSRTWAHTSHPNSILALLLPTWKGLAFFFSYRGRNPESVANFPLSFWTYLRISGLLIERITSHLSRLAPMPCCVIMKPIKFSPLTLKKQIFGLSGILCVRMVSNTFSKSTWWSLDFTNLTSSNINLHCFNNEVSSDELSSFPISKMSNRIV